MTVDTYAHLIPSANVSFIDRLDIVPEGKLKPPPVEDANPAQMTESGESGNSSEVFDSIGGGAWTRTTDLRIMRPSL